MEKAQAMGVVAVGEVDYISLRFRECALADVLHIYDTRNAQRVLSSKKFLIT